MDGLDRAILKAANSVNIQVFAKSKGAMANNIYICFGLKQDSSIWDERPLDRVKHWASLPTYQDHSFGLHFMPEGLDPFAIAEWLASEFRELGKTVKVEQWVAPNVFTPVEL